MPYPPSSSAAEELGGGMGAEGDGEQAQDKSIHIPADALPPGIKEGDTLKCVAMDDGGCTFELISSTAKDESPSWEQDFKASMSPQNPDREQAM